MTILAQQTYPVNPFPSQQHSTPTETSPLSQNISGNQGATSTEESNVGQVSPVSPQTMISDSRSQADTNQTADNVNERINTDFPPEPENPPTTQNKGSGQIISHFTPEVLKLLNQMFSQLKQSIRQQKESQLRENNQIIIEKLKEQIQQKISNSKSSESQKLQKIIASCSLIQTKVNSIQNKVSDLEKSLESSMQKYTSPLSSQLQSCKDTLSIVSTSTETISEQSKLIVSELSVQHRQINRQLQEHSKQIDLIKHSHNSLAQKIYKCNLSFTYSIEQNRQTHNLLKNSHNSLARQVYTNKSSFNQSHKQNHQALNLLKDRYDSLAQKHHILNSSFERSIETNQNILNQIILINSSQYDLIFSLNSNIIQSFSQIPQQNSTFVNQIHFLKKELQITTNLLKQLIETEIKSNTVKQTENFEKNTQSLKLIKQNLIISDHFAENQLHDDKKRRSENLEQPNSPDKVKQKSQKSDEDEYQCGCQKEIHNLWITQKRNFSNKDLQTKIGIQFKKAKYFQHIFKYWDQNQNGQSHHATYGQNQKNYQHKLVSSQQKQRYDREFLKDEKLILPHGSLIRENLKITRTEQKKIINQKKIPKTFCFQSIKKIFKKEIQPLFRAIRRVKSQIIILTKENRISRQIFQKIQFKKDISQPFTIDIGLFNPRHQNQQQSPKFYKSLIIDKNQLGFSTHLSENNNEIKKVKKRQKMRQEKNERQNQVLLKYIDEFNRSNIDAIAMEELREIIKNQEHSIIMNTTEGKDIYHEESENQANLCCQLDSQMNDSQKNHDQIHSQLQSSSYNNSNFDKNENINEINKSIHKTSFSFSSSFREINQGNYQENSLMAQSKQSSLPQGINHISREIDNENYIVQTPSINNISFISSELEFSDHENRIMNDTK